MQRYRYAILLVRNGVCASQDAAADSASDATGQGSGMRDTVKQTDRLAAMRLHHTLNAHLEDQGIATRRPSAPPPAYQPPRRSAY
jgi:hypothetical protein